MRWHDDVVTLEASAIDFMERGLIKHSGNWADIPRKIEALGKSVEHLLPSKLLPPDGKYPIDRSERTAAEIVFLQTGSPRWFVSKEIFDVVKTIDLQGYDQFEDALNVLPYDAFSIVFEKGCITEECVIGNLPPDNLVPGTSVKVELQSVFLAQLKSKQSRDILACSDFELPKRRVFLQRINGMVLAKGNFLNVLDEKLFNASVSGHIRKSESYGLEDLCVARIVVALLLLWRARPTFFVPAEQNREERRAYRGNSNLRRQIVFPELRRVYAPGRSCERNVSAHYRGWVLRTLRHPRFKRDENGNPRVIFVPPCAIHAEKLNQENFN